MRLYWPGLAGPKTKRRTVEPVRRWAWVGNADVSF
jgi:hypothetical protein